MALICLSLAMEDLKDVVEVANRVDSDLVEVRLDYLRDASDLSGLAGIRKPVISTCMPTWEGGSCKVLEDVRMGILESSLKHSDYVTIELDTKEKLREGLIAKAKAAGVKVIVAHHDFESTPPIIEILKTLEREMIVGADIGKVAYMPKERKDVLNLMDALYEWDDRWKGKKPAIALSMGAMGSITRLMAPMYGSYLTFGCAERGKESAPGQLTVDELKTMLGLLCDEDSDS
ncbi:MAG: type I 3-dehydroquinate dehydratase [Candidatus Altiarchaeota archaeon]